MLKTLYLFGVHLNVYPNRLYIQYKTDYLFHLKERKCNTCFSISQGYPLLTLMMLLSGLLVYSRGRKVLLLLSYIHIYIAPWRLARFTL